MASQPEQVKLHEDRPRHDLFGDRFELRVSEHAMHEAHKEGLRAADIIHAILTGTVVERYPERRRALVSGFDRLLRLPVHVVCDYSDLIEVVAITVYIPSKIRWKSHQQRRLRKKMRHPEAVK